ncbi:MAG: hypothetical protein AN485_10265 [Anabaena sp. MDT14b]|jgi:hypothetical protein|nr:MAG: hypothetical protein AN485_10265 [Anabaena sp. MDT14b]
MIEKLTTDSDYNYIKENQFQENLFLLLKFINLYCTCLKAYIPESVYYPLGNAIANFLNENGFTTTRSRN